MRHAAGHAARAEGEAALAAELRAFGLAVEAPPDGSPLRVERRFGVRRENEPPGLTAWLDAATMGWIGHFDDVEGLAAGIRRVARIRRWHHAGAFLVGLWLLGVTALVTFDRLADRLVPSGLRHALLLLVCAAGLVLLLVSRRALRRLGRRGDALAWEREGAVRRGGRAP